MKKIGIVFLIIGAVILVFGLLARVIPGMSITDFALGFFEGMGSALVVGGACYWLVDRFRAKKSQ